MLDSYVVGVDEVGRGPIAGPVCVASFILFDYSLINSKPAPLRDSKKLSQQKRNVWYSYLLQAEKDGRCAFSHAFVSASEIDKIGIVPSIDFAISECLSSLKNTVITLNNNKDEIFENKTRVLLDGGLHAPEQYLKQTTIIKGDEKEVTIMLASIVGKVIRDTFMEECSVLYPGYGFEMHKGYGTPKHYLALKRLGLTPLHRKSFLRPAQTGSKKVKK